MRHKAAGNTRRRCCMPNLTHQTCPCCPSCRHSLDHQSRPPHPQSRTRSTVLGCQQPGQGRPEAQLLARQRRTVQGGVGRSAANQAAASAATFWQAPSTCVKQPGDPATSWLACDQVFEWRTSRRAISASSSVAMASKNERHTRRATPSVVLKLYRRMPPYAAEGAQQKLRLCLPDRCLMHASCYSVVLHITSGHDCSSQFKCLQRCNSTLLGRHLQAPA